MHIKTVLKLPLLLTKSVVNKLRFSAFGIHSEIRSSLRLDGCKNIKIGDYVVIQYKTWLGALPLTGMGKAELIIEDGSIIGNFNHIFATKRIVIHKMVLTADKVFISDNLHGYEDVNVPILEQPIIQKGEVEIGEGSWIGENVCILGAKVGKHCIIGANSVVTQDIPDYCVAVGAPAIVIKRYDKESNQWKRCEAKRVM